MSKLKFQGRPINVKAKQTAQEKRAIKSKMLNIHAMFNREGGRCVSAKQLPFVKAQSK